MYFFKNVYVNEYSIDYQGIFGAGVIYPFYAVNDIEKLSNRPAVCTIDSTGLHDAIFIDEAQDFLGDLA